ncbi:nucleotidyltransferase domain-containing protein [Bacillus sp. SCS-153A]|uniref:nucleotidyltransferase domain-containing protein n=1 Tax=Rossellomorea sedimentorum TaxID=3115294 RepID=UPI003906BA63
MENWRKALKAFLEDWPYNSELAGVLVCGSYITGHPSNRSDIDVHMVLKEGEDWRERGNRVIDGYLIEYFCNPPIQIRTYFKEDYEERSTHAAVQFATGEIILDKEGTVSILKEEAYEWLQKPFEKTGETSLEFMKYAIWDSLDNLQDLHEKGGGGFTFVYHNSLKVLFEQYCQFLSVEQIPYYQIASYLSEESYLRKYLKEPFPDQEFLELYLDALKETEDEERILLYERLSRHVLSIMGGFSIDGWKIRSPIQK